MNEQIWFKTERWSTKIVPVQVVKVTEKTVTVRHKSFTIGGKEDRYTERRQDKNSSCENFSPTWEEAHAVLLERTEGALVSARRRLEEAQGEFGNVKGMKKPETE